VNGAGMKYDLGALAARIGNMAFRRTGTGRRGTACLAPWAWLLLVAGLLPAAPALAQQAPRLAHRAFIYWGYNRAQYTASDIRFTGSGYDFTLHDVRASDKPEGFSVNNYFNPRNIWIPQYNYRAGWFLDQHWSLSLGLDHMKYVVDRGQRVLRTGYINAGRWPGQAADNGEGELQLEPEVLSYEHTDGLNLLSVDADHYSLLWASGTGRHGCWFTQGLFAGAMIPRTDVRLFGEGLNNKFHLAGYGVGAQLGLFAVLHERVFARAAVRAGFVDLPGVLTTGKSEDRASQHFWFVEENVVLGVLIGRGKEPATP